MGPGKVMQILAAEEMIYVHILHVIALIFLFFFLRLQLEEYL